MRPHQSAPASFRPALLLAALLLSWSGARADDPAPRDNLQACLSGYSQCDPSRLSADEQRRVAAEAEHRHFQDCLLGRRCNEAKLGARQRSQVSQAVARINYGNCLRGDGLCRRDALDDAQRAEVEQADRNRNLDYCYNGLTACDASALTAGQRDEARRRYLQRNFANCMPGFEKFTRCNPEDLSEEQRTVVAQRLLEANLFVCTHALMGCIEELLTPQQRASLGARRPALLR